MAATNKNRNTQCRGSTRRVAPMAAGVVIPAGVLVAISTSTGHADNATALASTRVIGVTGERFSNAGGVAGAKDITVFRDMAYGPFANSAGPDQITAADLGAPCYVVDNQTVAKTSGSGARPVAGTVEAVDAAGVWVAV